MSGDWWVRLDLDALPKGERTRAVERLEELGLASSGIRYTETEDEGMRAKADIEAALSGIGVALPSPPDVVIWSTHVQEWVSGDVARDIDKAVEEGREIPPAKKSEGDKGDTLGGIIDGLLGGGWP